ncbi:5095_t:CDS:2, partial [Racocetra fulgida]
FGEFDNEMDFTTPVLFDRQDSDDYLKKLKDVKVETKNIVLQDELGLNRKDDENSADVNADNSDVDSGFGTDEDINNVIKKTQEKDAISKSSEVTNHTKVPLSVSPPKVIYYYQHEPSIENGPSPSPINNNHWSSYKQRRERLERRKHEQNLSTWNNRRRGSSSTDDPTTSPPPHFKSQLPSHKQKSSQLIYTPPISTPPPLSTPSNTLTSHKSPAVLSTSDQSSIKSLEKTPMKVTRSTKTNLGKMLAGVVMFNRSVKVGGQDNGNI